ncbi:P-loop containing nucleoside triphosphate hydrolase protein [Lophiostoma macrostomum CBS 122681]|uniref:RNA helicase n=1 Tax=Lophiostoma macrostomum CBS 122681 TaxID=1314788 RepID=A0A6A6SYF6_9PLEO|nr:P-loop containing nucleoside triphosphate hydrolase protein [Lophiostoma macrostomum CBS 122681]
MLRQATRTCVFCDVRSLLGPQSRPIYLQNRFYAQLQRDRGSRYDATDRDARPRPTFRGRPSADRGRDRPRPSRMVLSDTVARPPLGPYSDGRPARKPQDPFGHLNNTRAPPSLERRRDQGDRGGHFPSRRREDDKRRSRTEPFHALKMQKSLQDVSYGSRSAIKRKIQQVDSFEGLPLSDKVQEAIKDALPGLEYRNPTPAQAVAIPALLGITAKQRTRNPSKRSGLETFLLAAETGSGKTLAYLLPTIDTIKREEVIDAEEQAREEAEQVAARERDRRDDESALEPPSATGDVDPARPRAIILVPSAELVAQVGAVAKSLSHTVKFKAAPISAKNTPTVIRSRLFNEKGVDVVISTPPLLASIVESNPNILSRVTHLIVDEADSLFDRSFKPSTMEIIEKAAPSLKKLVLCSATIPRYLDKYFAERYPTMTRLVTPNLHAIPRRVQLGVVQVSKDPYRGNKMLACADTIWQIGRAKGDYDPEEGKESVATKHILVFVNEREETEEVAEYLVKKGIDAVAFHRDTDPNRQAKTLASFTGIAKEKAETSKEPTSAAASDSSKRRLPNTKVIVTTDLGSRGIDTVSVRHVILYDVPHTTIDFIHRLGRTGRMGRRGRGIVLAGAGDRHDVIKEVRDAMFRGEALI